MFLSYSFILREFPNTVYILYIIAWPMQSFRPNGTFTVPMLSKSPMHTEF